MQALTPKIRERRESACICFLEQGKTDKEEWFGQMKNGLPHSSSKPQEWSLLECGKSSQSWSSNWVEGAPKVIAWAGFVCLFTGFKDQ